MDKQHNTGPAVVEWLEKATKLKEAVLARLESLREAERAVAPAPWEWSASMVVEHLILFEENVVGQWRQRLLEMPSPNVGIRSSLLRSIVSFVVSKTKARAPSLPGLEPKEAMAVCDIKERWNCP